MTKYSKNGTRQVGKTGDRTWTLRVKARRLGEDMIKAKKKGEDSEGLFFWKRRGKSGGENSNTD